MANFFEQAMSWHLGDLKLGDVLIILVCVVIALIADRIMRYIFLRVR